jgi:triosephosphate isomerase
MRLPLIAGNWKMHKTSGEAVELVKGIKELGSPEGVELAVCPPFTALRDVFLVLKGSNIKLGAQNMHYEDSGAFTGEISPLMLKDLGVEYVIIGHSERRQLFGETDLMVNKKIHKALERELCPIVCVGETLEEREAGKTEEVVGNQIFKALDGVKPGDIVSVVIAYEPIWAIGTGKSATAEEANRVIGYIREVVETLAKDHGDRIRILYGGSVKPANAGELLKQPQIDGALVGGASLSVREFIDIAREAM